MLSGMCSPSSRRRMRRTEAEGPRLSNGSSGWGPGPAEVEARQKESRRGLLNGQGGRESPGWKHGPSADAAAVTCVGGAIAGGLRHIAPAGFVAGRPGWAEATSAPRDTTPREGDILRPQRAQAANCTAVMPSPRSLKRTEAVAGTSPTCEGRSR